MPHHGSIFAPSSERLLSRPFVLLCLASCLGAHAPNMLALLPRHLRAHGLDERSIGAVMGAFPLASILAMPAVARLSDRMGRRAPILAGLLLCALACAAFLVCHTLPEFLVARVVAGAGWAGILVGSSILVAEIAPPGQLARALGVAGILTLVAMALGPSIGEILVGTGGYPALFQVAAGLCVGGLLCAAALPAGRPVRLPRRAAGFGLAWGVAMRPALIASFLVAAGFGAVVSFMADLTALRHLGSVAPFFDSYVPAAILARLTCGGLSDRLGRHAVIIPALLAQAVALAALAGASSAWQLVPIGAVYGFSHGLYYPALTALVVERAADDARGRAIASFNFAFSAGVAASAFGNGFVAHRAGYAAVYLVCALAALGSVGVMASDRAGTRTAAELR